MTGRPSIRKPETVDYILDQVASGVPLAEVCRQDGMPHRSTFIDWVNADKDLSRRFAHAREDGEHMIAADALRIADDSANDYIETDDGPKLNQEHIQRAKLRIETRLKLLAKWSPKVWGDKLELAGDKDSPLTVVVRKFSDG